MYDIKRRAKFTTVGDLKKLLGGYADDVQVLVEGVLGWFHFDPDFGICLDTEDLESEYLKKYRVMVARYGFTEVEATSEEEALENCSDISVGDFDWGSPDWEDMKVIGEVE